MTDVTDPMIREILGLVAYQMKDGDHRRRGHSNWWGHDTDCGTDAEIMEQAREIVQRHLCGTTVTGYAPSIADTLKVFDVPGAIKGW